MKACGLTQGALYNHFKSKDELLHDIIASTQAELERHCQQAVAGAGDDPRARLAAFVRVYVVRHCRLQGRGAGRQSRDQLARCRTRAPTSGAAAAPSATSWSAILTEGVERGVFDPPQVDGRRDLKAMAMAMLDQWTHVSMWYGPGGRLSEEQMARLYADMALARRGRQAAVDRRPSARLNAAGGDDGCASKRFLSSFRPASRACTPDAGGSAAAVGAHVAADGDAVAPASGAGRSLARGADRRRQQQPGLRQRHRHPARALRGDGRARHQGADSSASGAGRRPRLASAANVVERPARGRRRGLPRLHDQPRRRERLLPAAPTGRCCRRPRSTGR